MSSCDQNCGARIEALERQVKEMTRLVFAEWISGERVSGIRGESPELGLVARVKLLEQQLEVAHETFGRLVEHLKKV